MTPEEKAASHLMQECAELAKAAGKFQMFGARPLFEGVQYDNVCDMQNEFIDVTKRFNELMALIWD